MAKPEREVTGFFWASAAYTLVAGAKSYELSNHLGNVMAVISDRGELQSAQDYFPFGMAMPGRSSGSYRYTFNGKETDPETGLNDFGARLYDNRIGRWLSIDPLWFKYPYFSPYVANGNNPLIFKDTDGRDIIVVVGNETFRLKSACDIKTVKDSEIKAYLEKMVRNQTGKSLFNKLAQDNDVAAYIATGTDERFDHKAITKQLSKGDLDFLPEGLKPEPVREAVKKDLTDQKQVYSVKVNTGNIINTEYGAEVTYHELFIHILIGDQYFIEEAYISGKGTDWGMILYTDQSDPQTTTHILGGLGEQGDATDTRKPHLESIQQFAIKLIMDGKVQVMGTNPITKRGAWTEMTKAQKDSLIAKVKTFSMYQYVNGAPVIEAEEKEPCKE